MKSTEPDEGKQLPVDSGDDVEGHGKQLPGPGGKQLPRSEEDSDDADVEGHFKQVGGKQLGGKQL